MFVCVCVFYGTAMYIGYGLHIIAFRARSVGKIKFDSAWSDFQNLLIVTPDRSPGKVELCWPATAIVNCTLYARSGCTLLAVHITL